MSKNCELTNVVDDFFNLLKHPFFNDYANLKKIDNYFYHRLDDFNDTPEIIENDFKLDEKENKYTLTIGVGKEVKKDDITIRILGDNELFVSTRAYDSKNHSTLKTASTYTLPEDIDPDSITAKRKDENLIISGKRKEIPEEETEYEIEIDR